MIYIIQNVCIMQVKIINQVTVNNSADEFFPNTEQLTLLCIYLIVFIVGFVVCCY